MVDFRGLGIGWLTFSGRGLGLAWLTFEGGGPWMVDFWRAGPPAGHGFKTVSQPPAPAVPSTRVLGTPWCGGPRRTDPWGSLGYLSTVFRDPSWDPFLGSLRDAKVELFGLPSLNYLGGSLGHHFGGISGRHLVEFVSVSRTRRMASFYVALPIAPSMRGRSMLASIIFC